MTDVTQLTAEELSNVPFDVLADAREIRIKKQAEERPRELVGKCFSSTFKGTWGDKRAFFRIKGLSKGTPAELIGDEFRIDPALGTKGEVFMVSMDRHLPDYRAFFTKDFTEITPEEFNSHIMEFVEAASAIMIYTKDS